MVDIFLSGFCRSMIRAPTSGIRCSGTTSGVAEARVEALAIVAHQLDVLALVVADRHLVGAVGEHVGGLQHRVEEEPGGHQLALLGRLLLELVMRLRSPCAVTLDSSQHSSVCSVHVALAEEDAALGSRPAASRIAVVS